MPGTGRTRRRESGCFTRRVNATESEKRIIQQIGEIGDAQAVPALIEALSDENWKNRKIAGVIDEFIRSPNRRKIMEGTDETE